MELRCAHTFMELRCAHTFMELRCAHTFMELRCAHTFMELRCAHTFMELRCAHTFMHEKMSNSASFLTSPFQVSDSSCPVNKHLIDLEFTKDTRPYFKPGLPYKGRVSNIYYIINRSSPLLYRYCYYSPLLVACHCIVGKPLY